MKKLVLAMVVSIGLLVVGCTSLNAPVAVTTNAIGAKVGQSSGSVYLGLFGAADYGVQKAAQNGGITRVATVDTQVKQFLGALVVTYTTTVTGE
jgi:hypothetical protein